MKYYYEVIEGYQSGPNIAVAGYEGKAQAERDAAARRAENPRRTYRLRKVQVIDPH